MLLGTRDNSISHSSLGGCQLEVSGTGKDPCYKSQVCDKTLVLYDMRRVKCKELGLRGLENGGWISECIRVTTRSGKEV